jgi:hypothetical protein
VLIARLLAVYRVCGLPGQIWNLIIREGFYECFLHP